MGVEIERKFLLDSIPPRLNKGWVMVQGYLARSPSVRVRLVTLPTGRLQAFLTLKGKGAISRPEFEYEIPFRDCQELLDMASTQISKIRYHVKFKGHTWEVDQFTGSHTGLWLAEIELSAVDEDFPLPPWLGREVSHDPRYRNSSLAEMGRAP